MAIKVEYDLIPWEDAPSTATPINAENLNKQQTKIKEIIDELYELDEAKLGKEEVPNVPVKSVNGKTGAVSLGKTDIGLGNVDNVKQYSASNPPPYPVTSVNGKTGAVTVSVPTKTSQLTNDSNFVTKSVTDALLGQKADKTAIPTKTSQLTNDSGFLTQHQDISGKANKGGWTPNMIIGVDGNGNMVARQTYTEAEKQALMQEIIDSIKVEYPEAHVIYGDVGDGNVITLRGNVTDGTYILNFEDENGNVTANIGTLIKGAINLIPTAKDDKGNALTNGVWYSNKRWNSSGSTSDATGYFITGLIPVQNGNTVTVEWETGGEVDKIQMQAFYADKTKASGYLALQYFLNNYSSDGYEGSGDITKGKWEFKLNGAFKMPTNIAYLTMTLYGNPANCSVKVKG